MGRLCYNFSKSDMKYVLAIDQGTTGSRAIIFDEQGKVVASSYHEFPQYFPHPGWVEHNPNEIWESVNLSIQKVLKKVSPTMIAAIGITNQRETTVLWDKETGKPVYNAIVWQCRRTANRCDQIKKQKGRVDFFRKRSGLPVDAYFSGTKVEWLLRNIPATKSLTKKGRLLFGNTDTWVLWKLTGGKSHATDYTNASRTLLFNINKKVWDNEILSFFKIPINILPKVQPSSSNFGKTVKIGKLPAGIPITGIAGDQQAALFGQTCFEPGTMKNTYGTGCFVLLNSGKKRPESKHGLITTLGCGADGKPVYVLEGSIFIAGAAIQWLRDGLQIIKKASEAEKMSTSLKDNSGVYFVPAFVGLGAPYWDQAARGTITGLTRGVKREHLVRAATEAMCYSTRDIINIMEKESKLKIKNLRVDGGAVRNNFLCQFQADILGKSVIRPKVTELTALGAAFLAGLSIKLWKNAAQIKHLWAIDKVFNPHLPKKVVDGYYAGWQAAIRRTLSKS